MYYALAPGILFRRYEKFGYLTDNSEFGYRFTNDDLKHPGDKFVSGSGATMLSLLGRKPWHIEDIVNELEQIFPGTDKHDLKNDAIEFFDQLSDMGFLNRFSDDCKLVSTPSPQIASMEAASESEFDPGNLLRSIHIEIAGGCNERCVHCYIPHARKSMIMDLDLFEKIVSESREYNLTNVTLSGGEPLLHEEFSGFLDFCHDMDMSINVLSNLTLLTDELAEKMGDIPLLSVQTSLYSMNPQAHDDITGVPGSFAKTKKGILKLLSAGVPLQISCPVMKQNKNSFMDVVRWGRDQHVVVAVEPVLFPIYDGTRVNLTNRLALEEIGDVAEMRIRDGYGEMMREIAREKALQKADDPVCTVCSHKLCVSANGDVFPCVGWQNRVIGNLRNQTLKEIWEESEEIKRLRDVRLSQFSRCVDCADRPYCTICMMANSNENPDRDILRVDDFHCQAAALTHELVSRNS